jgi:hypothetical protein
VPSVNLSAWFDALPVAAKIGGVILITLAAMAAAAGFVGSVARFAQVLTRVLRRSRGKRDRDGRV